MRAPERLKSSSIDSTAVVSTEESSGDDTTEFRAVPPNRGVVNVTLRRFDPSRDDPAALRALHERALRDAGTDPADVPGTEDLGRVPGTYLDGGEFLVGYEGENLVAMGGFRPAADLPAGGHEGFDDGVEPDRTVELFRIAVAPGAQGRGLGSRVLAELESRAAAAGYDRVVLTTAARQRAGLELYRSRAYEEVGRLQEGDYELVRFRKRLGESDGRRYG